MIRPGLFLAITFSACVAIAGALDAEAAQKPAAPAAAPKGGGWSTAETPAGAYDPAYAAYDSGRYEQALKLASEGAAKGEVQADTLLGRLYAEGSASARTMQRLLEWFTKGAVAGDKHAQFELGLMLAKGRGVKQDEKKAADFFEAAAQQGHTLAAYNLAQTYVEGWARPQDLQKAAVLARTGCKERPQPSRLRSRHII